MRFTKTVVATFASLLLAAGCLDFGSKESALSGDDEGQAGDCTLTQGFWKNHPEAWPVSSLSLGTSTYSKEALVAILRMPVQGNGLIKLAHQLIAVKLNLAAGANGASISATITAADALIGDLEIGVDRLDSKSTSALNDKLDAFNKGGTGPGHCDDAPKPPSCHADGGGSCDDEHDCDHDSDCDHGDGGDDDCDHDDDGDCDHGDEGDDECEHEDCDHDGDGDCDGQAPAPVCGDGHVDAGETCDDGNTIPHDGCSAICTLELSY